MLHLVLHYCYESFAPSYFQNEFVRRLAQWGAVQYSSLFCLEGLILAIKYGRTISKAEGQFDQLDTGAFWKRHAMEIYPIYLVACAATWAFQCLVAGLNDWRQLFLTLSMVDVSPPPGKHAQHPSTHHCLQPDAVSRSAPVLQCRFAAGLGAAQR